VERVGSPLRRQPSLDCDREIWAFRFRGEQPPEMPIERRPCRKFLIRTWSNRSGRSALDCQLIRVGAFLAATGGNTFNAFHQGIYIEWLPDHRLNHARGLKSLGGIGAC